MDRLERTELGKCVVCGYEFWEAGGIDCALHRAAMMPNPLDGQLTAHTLSDLVVDLRTELDLRQRQKENPTVSEEPLFTEESVVGQAGSESPEPSNTGAEKAETPLEKVLIEGFKVILEDSIPPPRKYAHSGKRRRSYTDELFRCQFVDMISRTPLICNHLLWRNNLPALRDHLAEHMKVEEVQVLTDTQIKEKYAEAKRIFLEHIPEDGDPEEDEEDCDDDSDPDSDNF